MRRCAINASQQLRKVGLLNPRALVLAVRPVDDEVPPVEVRRAEGPPRIERVGGPFEFDEREAPRAAVVALRHAHRLDSDPPNVEIAPSTPS